MRLLLLLLFPVIVKGQLFTRDATRPGFAGGLNAAQVSTMDLNHDGISDLVVYDRMGSKVVPYLGTVDNAWVYAPDYAATFPSEVSSFVLLRDYDGDGKKDLFTFGQVGILVFRNTTTSSGLPSWQKIRFLNPATGLKSDVMLTTGFSGKTNILPGSSDVPHFGDVDGDGDLDVINMRFVSPATAEYHKNMSMELYGKPDSLEFVRQTTSWGNFTECSCGKIAFGTQTCADIGGRINHTGGKFLLALDYDHDGDQDMLFSEENCTTLYYMENVGDATNASFTGFTVFLPDLPGNFPFPTAYLEDVNFDGVSDLMVSTNLNLRPNQSLDFSASISEYRNVGTNQLPNFQFQRNDFLQSEMIDVGDESAPCLYDVDEDGDLDMILGQYNRNGADAGLYLFENTGTFLNPTFELSNDNWMNLTGRQLLRTRPQITDMNADGRPDLVVAAVNALTGNGGIYYFPDDAAPGFQPNSLDMRSISFSFGSQENVWLTDVDQDGNSDILLGTSGGSLEYWRNLGNNTFALHDDSYLGLGTSPGRLYISATTADADGDGEDDLIVSDLGGTVTIFSSFRSNPATGATEILRNELTGNVQTLYGGSRTRPAAGSLQGNKAAYIVTGSVLGGVELFVNTLTTTGSEPPAIIYPNPILSGFPATFFSRESAVVDIFTALGQQTGIQFTVPANVAVKYAFQTLTSGVYIARFQMKSRIVSLRLVIR